MNIRVRDVEQLVDKASEKLNAGYKWSVLEYFTSTENLNQVHFYSDGDIAEKFSASLDKESRKGKVIETDALQQLMETILQRDSQRSEIDYYNIDLSSLAVSKIMKTNPDQNPLHDPDGNTFTDELISSIERQGGEVKPQQVPFETFGEISDFLAAKGFDPDFFLTLEAGMSRGVDSHEEITYDQYGQDIVMFNHVFAKDSDGRYYLDSLTGTLYFNLEIDHATINGIDTQALEMEMRDLDWDYDGRKFLKQNEPVFEKLCEDPLGREIAVKLFNNHAIYSWFDKPDFLSSVEDELHIYPKMGFTGESTATNIYQSLKSYQEISADLSKFTLPGRNNQERNYLLIKWLMKEGPVFLVAPGGPRKGDDVILSWDPISKELRFSFKEGVKMDARAYFEKGRHEDFDSIINELEQYPLLQLSNPAKREILVENILKGNKVPVHLERKIIPAEHIDSYIVVERRYPDENQSYRPTELFRSDDHQNAISEMRKIGEGYLLDESKVNSALLVIGQYKGKALDYDQDQMPTINSGFRIATINDISPDGYFFSTQGGVKLTNVLTEQIFVERDKDSQRLVFYTKHGQVMNIDKDFWCQKSAKPDVSLGNDEGLLPKMRTSSDKGMKL